MKSSKFEKYKRLRRHHCCPGKPSQRAYKWLRLSVIHALWSKNDLKRGETLKACLAAFSEQRQCRMNAGRTVFSQLIEFLPHQEFQKCVAEVNDVLDASVDPRRYKNLRIKSQGEPAKAAWNDRSNVVWHLALVVDKRCNRSRNSTCCRSIS